MYNVPLEKNKFFQTKLCEAHVFTRDCLYKGQKVDSRAITLGRHSN